MPCGGERQTQVTDKNEFHINDNKDNRLLAMLFEISLPKELSVLPLLSFCFCFDHLYDCF